MIQKEKKIQIIPIGGLEEVGKNLTVYQYKNEIILVDCGVKFAEQDHLGVDFIINDFSYLIANQEKIKAIIITHGHLDHIGALSFLLKKISIEIYATKFSKALIEKNLSEKLKKDSYKVNLIKIGKIFNIGNFKIDPIHVNHSIVDAVAFAITTDVGTIIHTGDFKIDKDNTFEKEINLNKFKYYGDKGVLALLADSTNSLSEGSSITEKDIHKNLLNIFSTAKGRILIATFSSQINRIKHIISLAKLTNKKIAITGRSMLNNIDIAKELNIIDIKDDVFVDVSNIKNIEDSKLIILITGTQGEIESGMTLVSLGKHNFIKLRVADTVLFSSSAIPGNEKGIINVINNLYKRKINVITNKQIPVHVSGHAKKEELITLLNLVKPKYFIPIHGESAMLYHHIKYAIETGVSKGNVFLLENGNRLEMGKTSAKVLDKLKLKTVYVEGEQINDLTEEILLERKTLSKHGIVILNIVILNEELKIFHFQTKGVLNRSMNESFLMQLKEELKKYISIEIQKGLLESQTTKLNNNLKKKIKEIFYKEKKKNPMININIDVIS